MTTRREFFLSLAAIAGAPAWVNAAVPALKHGNMLAAAWQAGTGYQVGVLAMGGAELGEIAVIAAIDVPSRAHGLLLDPSGSLIVVARRPGNWMLRWDREGDAVAWHWIEPSRAFAGHLLISADGRTLYTTEFDLESGAGLIGVRDAATFEKRMEWPTHGTDPHQLLWDESSPGNLIVANGGVSARPETGRLKLDLDRMDSSLSRLGGIAGELLGQWRLADSRLSLRHLAWNTDAANRPVLGIALQAEHDSATEKSSAPVLALFDGHALRTVVASRPLSGYGGSIAAIGDGFAVSCPRAQGIAVYGANGFRRLVPLTEACPLATSQGRLWAGGSSRVLGTEGNAAVFEDEIIGKDIRLDNHWIAIS